MKKLMTVLASAATALCAVGASPDFTETYTDFEGLTAGQAFDSENGMDEYWVGTSDAELFITNHTDTISVSRPNYDGRSDANANYLAIDNSVTRGLKIEDGEFAGVAIPTDGIYLDTLVKFTAADEVFGEDALASGDKIAIEYVAQGDDVDNPITNFVIRAGYIGAQEISAVNYMADVPENFDVSAWHRLTVRTFASIDAADHVGFVVYLDEVPLAYSTSDACGDNFVATGLAADYYTSELHALYPSAVDSQATGGSTIASATFSGTGCIDDVVFSTEPRDFISVDPDVTVTWDASVATLTLNGAAVEDFVAGTAGSAKVTPVEGVVTVAATFAAGWEYGACATDGAGAWDAANEQFTGLSAGETCNIVGMKPLFDVGGVHYASIADKALLAALAAGTEGTPATLTLLDNVDTPIEVTEGYIILDLAGKTITDAEDGEGQTAGYAISNAGANLTIINSTETIGHVVASEGGAAVVLTDDGLTTITAGIFDGVFDGQGVGNLVITGGTFYDEEYDGDAVTDFYLAGYVSGATPAYIGEHYFQVGGGVPPTPSVVQIPTAASNLTYDGTEQTGVAAGTGYTLTGTAAATNAGDYSATATLEEGYIWSDDTTEAKVFNWSIAPKTDATVDVTLTTEIAEYSAQLEFPTASAKIGGDDVAGTPAWDPTTISEPEAGATNTYTVTFTVTTANYAGSTGTATFKVYKVAGGGSDYPSYIDDITDPTEKAAYEKKYDTWATTYSVADGAGNEEAFLLNCAPADVETAKANFKIPSITVDAEGNVTVGTIDGTFNGKLQLKGSTDLSTWTNLDAASKDYNFFKYELTY